jgi:uncharacterized protein (TIGR02147 family)
MFFMGNNYREIIQSEFARRSLTHRTYSLRAFARDIGVAPARLSEVLNGKKGLSRDAAAKIAPRIGLKESETAIFCDMVESQHARAKITRDSAKSRLGVVEATVHTIQLDAFQLISEWHHFAILQLIETKDFKNSYGWISERLGISQAQAKAATERLKRMGLVVEKAGKLRTLKDFVATPDVPSAAIRENHKQIRAKALQALESQTIDERDFSSVQMPIDTKDIVKAKKRIREFRRKFCSEFSAAKNKDAVYCLTLDFFNLTPHKPERLQ